jgi:hypothetical protein
MQLICSADNKKGSRLAIIISSIATFVTIINYQLCPKPTIFEVLGISNLYEISEPQKQSPIFLDPNRFGFILNKK